MVKVIRVAVLPMVFVLSLLASTRADAAPALPNSMAALGDSITRAYDACCWYGEHPSDSWSTGGNAFDGVSSHYERLRELNPQIAGRQADDAVTGAKANDLSRQVENAVAKRPDYVTILIGANDLCTSSTRTMTSVATFTSEVTAALAALHQQLPEARIFVGSIPNLYQLWSVLHTDGWARFVWSVAGICQSMLAPTNTEAQRQQVAQRELAFNHVLAESCRQYSRCRWDGDAVYHHAFTPSQVSRLDYFHPSLSGQSALADTTWAASWWG
jgi:lysophospholipase L1-like esterase